MTFQLLGSNGVECGFILAGLNYTEGVSICEKIEGALMQGNVAIEVQEEKISFIAEGLSCAFLADKARLAAIEQMLEDGNVQREPYGDSNYQGFRLTRRF